MSTGEMERAHEPSGIAVATLLRIGALTIIGVALAIAAIGMVLKHGTLPRHALLVSRTDIVPPAPRLQATPRLDIEAERTRIARELERWHWADATHAYASIPIERAMELYVRQRSEALLHEDARGTK